jgi:hypothetical protein
MFSCSTITTRQLRNFAFPSKQTTTCASISLRCSGSDESCFRIRYGELHPNQKKKENALATCEHDLVEDESVKEALGDAR